MKWLIRHQLYLVLTVLLLVASTGIASAEKQVADLTGEDKEMYDKFRNLFTNGTPEDFYPFAQEYEKDLRGKGYMMLYYKLKNNEGFFALRHNQLYKAIQFAEELDEEIRKAGAQEYFYLATGLYGDIYNTSHDSHRAEGYFMLALDEVGDTDPKFTIRTYMNLSEMLCLRNPEKSLEWADKSIAMAKELKNIDYLSLSLGLKGYVLFLKGDGMQFDQLFEEYVSLQNTGDPEFNHRYDNILEAAKLAFDHDYSNALNKVHQGNLAVDSSLCVLQIYTMARDIEHVMKAVRNRSIEMDSVYSLMQDANFNQLAAETSLLRSRAELDANKRQVRTLTNWLMLIIVVFLVVYIMGRRRLVRKIWARSKELKAALIRAEESDRMKSAFIQNMSHEIRTPLNAVAGFSDILCTPDYELSDAEKLDMKARIEDNVHQITTIVNEVLELSKSESESMVTEDDMTDVWCNNLCRSLLRDVKGSQNKGVELRFNSNVKDDFKIHTSLYRLHSALSHLMDNAIKFTDQGHIQLSCEKREGQLLLSVSDTGVGIKKEDRSRIFDNFSKVDDFKEGIGLGLPICRRLIRSLGGDVALDTDYQEGARFVITLPIK